MKRYVDASWKAHVGLTKHKALLRMPMIKMGTVPTIEGSNTQIFVDCFGECRSCNEQVWFGRLAPGRQWIPVLEKKDEDGVYELHRCDGELKRNKELRRVTYGEELKIIDE